jgi:hypothetical protein
MGCKENRRFTAGIAQTSELYSKQMNGFITVFALVLILETNQTLIS